MNTSNRSAGIPQPVRATLGAGVPRVDSDPACFTWQAGALASRGSVHF